VRQWSSFLSRTVVRAKKMLQTVSPLTVGLGDGAVHLMSTLGSAVISARGERVGERGEVWRDVLPQVVCVAQLVKRSPIAEKLDFCAAHHRLNQLGHSMKHASEAWWRRTHPSRVGHATWPIVHPSMQRTDGLTSMMIAFPSSRVSVVKEARIKDPPVACAIMV
jgi:hypothetical protein